MDQNTSGIRNSQNPQRTAWNPKTIGLFSLFLTIVPAGILYILNLGRLGLKDRRGYAVAGLSVVVLVFLFLLLVFAESKAFWTILIVNTVISAVLYKSQLPAYRRFLSDGGRKAEFLIPAVCVFGSLIVLLTALVLYETYARDMIWEEYDFEPDESEGYDGLNEANKSIAQPEGVAKEYR